MKTLNDIQSSIDGNKIERRNYLLKNHFIKMMVLSKRTDLAIDIRKKIFDNILRLTTVITIAVKLKKLQNKSLISKYIR